MYNIYNTLDLVNNVKDDNNISLHGHGNVTIDKEGAKVISQGINTIGSQLGLGASIAGIGAAVANGIAKSSMPPLQKAGVIVGSALLTGFGH
jgi:hypothetical protein